MLLAVWDKNAIINAIEQKRKKIKALGEMDCDFSNSEISDASNIETFNSINSIDNENSSWFKRFIWPIIFIAIAICLKVLIKCNTG